MRDQNIISVFNNRYPELKVATYMPCWSSINNQEGIMILLDNGDAFIYFPNPDMGGEEE